MAIENQNICRMCAVSGGSCCVNMQIYLTGEDIKRIEAATRNRDFFRHERPWSWCDRDEADPVWEKHIFSCARRRVVRRRVDGSCHFLGEHGCVLELETRPLVCRLYPYEYGPEGICGLHPGCPVSRSETPGTDLQTMGMESDRVKAWHAAFYAELVRGTNRGVTHQDQDHLISPRHIP